MGRLFGRLVILSVLVASTAQDHSPYSAEAEAFLQRYRDDWEAYVRFHAKQGSPERREATEEERRSFQRSAWSALRSLNAEDFPSLGGRYELTQAQVDFYREYGFLYLPQVFTPAEIRAYRGAIHLAMHTDTHPLTRRPSFIRVYNLWDRHAVIAKFVLNQRLGAIVAQLMGTAPVRLYQDQTFFKGGSDGLSPAHQDMMAAPFEWAEDASDAHKTLGAWIPLQAVNSSSGLLGYAPASHLQGKLGKGYDFRDGLLRESEAHLTFVGKFEKLARMAEAAGLSHPSTWHKVPDVSALNQGMYVIPATALQEGDVVLHDGWLAHAAGPKAPSLPTREAITIQYFAEGLRRGAQATPRGLYYHDSNSVSRWADSFARGDLVRDEWLPVVCNKVERVVGARDGAGVDNEEAGEDSDGAERVKEEL